MQALGLTWGATALRSAPAVTETHIVRSAPIHRGARLLLDVWREREAQGRFVVGRDVPSRGLARVLSGLVLYEPLQTGDFRVRLAGHALHRRFGRDVTGETLSRLLDEAQFIQHACQMRALLMNGEPFVLEVRLMEEGRLKLCYELVALRVFAPDGKTPWVLSGLFFHDWRL
jgi:hypothetical protein